MKVEGFTIKLVIPHATFVTIYLPSGPLAQS